MFFRCHGHLVIPSNFDGSMVATPWPRQTPRKLISSFLNLHFDGLRNSDSFLKSLNSSWQICSCKSSSSIFVAMSMLSM